MSAFWGGFADTLLQSRQAEQKRIDDENKLKLASKLQMDLQVALEAARQKVKEADAAGAVVNTTYDPISNATIETTRGGEQRSIPLPEAARAQYRQKLEAEAAEAARKAAVDQSLIDQRRSSVGTNIAREDAYRARAERDRRPSDDEPKKDTSLDNAQKYIDKRLKEDVYTIEGIEPAERMELATLLRQTVAGSSDVGAIGAVIDSELKKFFRKRADEKAAAAAARSGR